MKQVTVMSDNENLYWERYVSDRVQILESTSGLVFKVICKDKSFRSKTFKGEMAWADSKRYASDKTGSFIYF